jgi:hypothetical protein
MSVHSSKPIMAIAKLVHHTYCIVNTRTLKGGGGLLPASANFLLHVKFTAVKREIAISKISKKTFLSQTLVQRTFKRDSPARSKGGKIYL